MRLPISLSLMFVLHLGHYWPRVGLIAPGDYELTSECIAATTDPAIHSPAIAHGKRGSFFEKPAEA